MALSPGAGGLLDGGTQEANYRHDTQALDDGGRQETFEYTSPEGELFTEVYRYDPDGKLVERTLRRLEKVENPIEQGKPDGFADFPDLSMETTIVSRFDEDGNQVDDITRREIVDRPDGSRTEFVNHQDFDGNTTWQRVDTSEDGQVRAREPRPTHPMEVEAPPLAGEVPASQFSSQEVDLAGGGFRLTTRFKDPLSGRQESQVTFFDPDGNPTQRISESLRQTEVDRDVAGLGILDGLIRNPQGLINSLGEGPLTQTETKQKIETFGPDGAPQEVTRNLTSWDDGQGTQVTRVEQEGQATQWKVVKHEDGREVSQTFVEGSEDTTISETYVDEDGFEVQHVQSTTPDLAEQVGAPQASDTVVRVKQDARADDVRKILGDDAFDKLSPRVRELIEAGQFQLTELDSRQDYQDHRQDVHALVLAGPDGQRLALDCDPESGDWSESSPPGFDQAGLDRPEEAPHSGSSSARADAILAIFGGTAWDKLTGSASLARQGGGLISVLATTPGAHTLGKALGLAGSGWLAFQGVSELVDGDPYRGGIDLLSGAGGLMTTAGIAGPLGWIAVGAGTCLGLAYDYMDRHRIADLQI
ncbi:MAG: hypothetical protein KC910_13645 [Candidatus Eremiobacteraeota bacterium]|nr:hypothetical protein [Candidatus Eremiobacteraeota bacterium]